MDSLRPKLKNPNFEKIKKINVIISVLFQT